jgi:hypothetical protein
MTNECDPCLLFCDFKTSRKAQDLESTENFFLVAIFSAYWTDTFQFSDTFTYPSAAASSPGTRALMCRRFLVTYRGYRQSS